MAGTRDRARERPRLIINADDFAFTPGVTAGILDAHAAGTVTSTSMMVGCPGWEDGVRRARATPRLDVGLHFNLLVGRPFTNAASLRGPAGEFLTLAALVRRALLGRVRAREVEAECEAQLAALRDAGVAVSHIDSHRHVHALPGIASAVARVADAHALALRHPLEWSPHRAALAPSRMRGALVGAAWHVASRAAPATRAPDHFVGPLLQGDRGFAARLLNLLDRLPPGVTELMVHPGRVDRVLETVDSYTWQREREREALTEGALVERLRRGDLALADFRDL
ncbi:MAG TPA: ChbG/HpnK family deacetylase [Gemmatimonadaceae bacterium]|nr:ChbG/HpnK family deacetylase [Gemmatimonadaceae bacterium]